MAQSSRSGRAPVKSGWSRHLEGWQPAAVALFIAATSAALVVPRPVAPTELPAPAVDARALARAAAADAARAEAAEREGLDVDVRALGSAFRAFGQVDARPDRPDAEIITARRRLVDAFGPARAQGEEALLRLRAFQLRAFLREVRRWEATGDASDELRALGGDFVGLLRRSGWVEERRGRRRVIVDAATLAVLFKKRWNAVVGAEGASFAPSLDEARAFYRFLLAHPIWGSGSPDGALRPKPLREPAAETRLLRQREAQYRLKKIDELAAIDATYPRDLARGVVLYSLERYPAAVESFRRHLEASPDGPHALRARNYLRAALGRANDEPL